jgi:riboflavin kinase
MPPATPSPGQTVRRSDAPHPDARCWPGAGVQPPFPLKLRGPVVKGFGRGSKDLGIPTANIPLAGLTIGGHDDLESGIYYGYASLDHSTIPALTTALSVPSATGDTAIPERSSNHAVADLETPATAPPSRPMTPGRLWEAKVYPTVLSIGYNPYYKNSQRSIEIHILHSFAQDFYGATLSLIILGHIRPEYDYVSREALVEDIREDIRVAQRSLARPAYEQCQQDPWLSGEGDAQHEARGQTGTPAKSETVP